ATTSIVVSLAPQQRAGIDFNMRISGAAIRGRVTDVPFNNNPRNIGDDFDDGILTDRWKATSGPQSQAVETGGRLELRTTAPSNSARVTSTCVATGNLTATIDFTLLNWSAGNLTRLTFF